MPQQKAETCALSEYPKVPRWLHIGLLEVWGGGQEERMLSTRLIKLEASFASSFLGM